MPHSKTKSKPDKPHPDFPLFCHKGTGRWCKKVRGRLVYLGYKRDDPDGQIAFGKWLDQKDELLAGRKPRDKNSDCITIVKLIDHFLHHKKQLIDSGELAQRTWNRYEATGLMLAAFFGRSRPATMFAKMTSRACAWPWRSDWGRWRWGMKSKLSGASPVTA